MWFTTLGNDDGAAIIAAPSSAPATSIGTTVRTITVATPYNQTIIRPTNFVPPIPLRAQGGSQTVFGAFTIASFTSVGDSSLVVSRL